jgi:hypothetical protein
VAGGGEQLELVVGRAAALLREALAVVALGQQVLEIARPVAVAARDAGVARRGQDGACRGLVGATVGQGKRRAPASAMYASSNDTRRMSPYCER